MVLKKILNILESDQLSWSFKHVTAIGMSSSKPILDNQGNED